MSTTTVPKHVFEIVASSAAILQVIGTADLSPGAAFRLRSTCGPHRSGWVIAITGAGTRAVIEVEGERWLLHRRGNIVNTGSEPCFHWIVVDCSEEEEILRR